jgi:hypothetical protein
LYNHLWINNKIPDEWTEAIIIPILKPGKDAKEAENYRPISLTSSICSHGKNASLGSWKKLTSQFI